MELGKPLHLVLKKLAIEKTTTHTYKSLYRELG